MNSIVKEAAVLEHNKVPASVWGSAGEAYDKISRGIADAIEHCVDRLDPRAGERILDLATGTGWTARRLAELEARVTAVDFAPEVIAVAQSRAARRNYDIAFEVGDAEALSFADNSFDGVISTFGVMFASRPEHAARELGRVCKAGGRIVLGTWTPDGSVFGMFKVMKAYMPAPAGNPPPSPFAWGNPDRVRELLSDDFELTFEEGMSYYREPDGAAAWNTFSKGYGPLRTLLGKLDDGAKAGLEKDFIEFHDGYPAPLGICVPREYWAIHGTRR